MVEYQQEESVYSIIPVTVRPTVRKELIWLQHQEAMVENTEFSGGL